MQMLNSDIEHAVSIIKKGGVVAFPTDTVYGLGGDATNTQACDKIFQHKKRSKNNPLIIHVSSLNQARDIAYINEDALKLSILWPGPLTMILSLKKSSQISQTALANLDTIAIRIPNSKIALRLIEESDCPIAAPSANLSGFLTTTSYKDVKLNFPEEVFIIADYERIFCGIESTVVDLTTDQPILLRPGYITKNKLTQILNKKILIPNKDLEIRSPGMSLKHYSPRSPIRLNAVSLKKDEVGLDFGNIGNFDTKFPDNFSINLSKKFSLEEATKNLFEYLHKLDAYALANNKSLAIVPIQKEGLGYAINDRLTRAANNTTILS